MEEEENYDFLVCLSIETTDGFVPTAKGYLEESSFTSTRFLYMAEADTEIPKSAYKKAEFPNIIEIDWYN